MSDDGIESSAAEFHQVYQAEAKRQGDVRHKDAYDDLAENIKDFDRALARHVLRLIALREAEARLDELRRWNSPYSPNAMDRRIEELERQRDALLSKTPSEVEVKKEAEHDAS